ncbi:MAG TPA: protein kinase, partial [Longilinea sp.]|nr:protein kinase [Longilinea sp.]
MIASMEIGTLFNNRYLLVDELGKGAMGAIFHAHDTVLDRDVAIKIVSQGSLGTEGRVRLLREAQSAAKLNHPNIVSIFDAGEVGDQPYIVMELIAGKSLFEDKPQGQVEILDFAKQICSALSHAHKHDIIHRDLKPENVLRTPSGLIKLTDFGLARSVSSRMSVEGSIVGTVFYIAPESVQGKPVDGRADLYALGIMLYEWSTGVLPFTSDDPLGVISQHLYTLPVPPHVHNPSVQPGMETLILRLLSKTPDDRPASAEEVADALEALRETPGEFQSTPAYQLERIMRGKVVGRQRELEEMSSLWQQTAAGEGQVLLVSGEPGIGKTRLVRELMVRAAVSGGKVLMGECYAEGSIPYAPFGQMVEIAAQDTVISKLAYPEFAISGMAKIASALRADKPIIASAAASDPTSEQQQVLESITAWTSTIAANAPLLLFIDDIHWADSGTMALLRHLARRAPRMRLLLVMTYREIELNESSPLQSMLAEMNRERSATRIKLMRFDLTATGDMLSSILTPNGKVEPNLVNAIFVETEGNPFFIEEVCKSLMEQELLVYEDGQWSAPHIEHIEIPQSIRLTIQTRLSHLSEETHDILRTAATIGREFSFKLLQKATGKEEDELIDSLEQAEMAQIIRELPRGRIGVSFAFAHALIPNTLKEGLGGLRRQKLHRRVAESISELFPNDFESLAYHYEEAGNADCALEAYTKAAERALSVYTNREAVRYYNEALDLVQDNSEKANLLAGLGEALFRENKFQSAIDTWEKAIVLFRELRNFDRIAYLMARSARSAWYLDQYPQSLQICQKGMALIQGQPESPGQAALLHEMARSYRFLNQFDEALPLARKALDMAKRLNLVDVQADTLATIGILNNLPADELQSALEEAARLADSAGLMAISIRAHINLGGHFSRMGDFINSRIQFTIVRQAAQQTGAIYNDFDILTSIIQIDRLLGDMESADRGVIELKKLKDNVPNPIVGDYLIRFAEITRLRTIGELDQAVAGYTELLAEKNAEITDKLVSTTLLALVEVLLEQGKAKEALLRLEEYQRLIDIEMVEHQLDFHTLRQQALLAVGRIEKARMQIDLAIKHRIPVPSKMDDMVIERMRCRQAAAEKDWPTAFAGYNALLDVLVKSRLRLNQADLLCEYAKHLQEKGAPEDMV